MSLLEALKWRHASKHMNGQVVPEEKVEAILEAARLSPTSSGLQPFEILVITNQELKEKILPIANGQQVIVGASHLLVFAAWDNYTEKRLNDYFELSVSERGSSPTTEAYRKKLIEMYVPRDAGQNYAHAARQAYIAFGLAIGEAAMEKVDTTPMEGFNAEALDELLGLKQKGLRSVTILALGYRTPDKDWNAPLKKVRRSRESFVTELV